MVIGQTELDFKNYISTLITLLCVQTYTTVPSVGSLQQKNSIKSSS